MSERRDDWREALAPTPECIDIARLGEELDAAEREHLASCAHCQSELALFREFQSDEATPEEAEAAKWIAGELGRRLPVADNVRPFRPRPLRPLYAVAAAMLLVLGIGLFLQLREPSIDSPLGTGPYRSARLELVAPKGDLAQAPNELHWTAVPHASLYRARIVEVDGTVVWSGETTQTRVALPPAAIEQFAPGKSLRWEVQAFRGTEILASSETQTVRVNR